MDEEPQALDMRLFCLELAMRERDELISTNEARRRFRVAPATLRRRVESGELEAFTIDRDRRPILYRLTDLERMCEPRPWRPQRQEVTA